jgi:predicted dithiol-disulfide oxidoreductase (DUF899 family)
MATEHEIVTHDEWLKARTAFLETEKEFTRLRDEHARQRRALPWERVEKEYVFDGPNGRQTLADLFDGRSQLVVYHFMFAPNASAGCPHCSLRADGFDGIQVHLNHRDVSMVCASRAPYPVLADYQKRMGWKFTWVSSGASDFNRDYFVYFTPDELAAKRAYFNYAMQNPGPADREGHSVFFKDDSGTVFHTYSCYDRGNDLLNIHYHYLDMVPNGRDEGGRGPFWVKRHDEY